MTFGPSSAMARKLEHWRPDELPSKGAIYAKYGDLPSRELAITSAAVLDVALAQLLTMRLVEHEREAGEFWGLNGDGRAPAGSFGSRIQLALLVGLITPKDAAILRGVKGLRNLFAHRVHIGLLSPEAVMVTTSLHTLWVKTHTAVVETDACSEVSAELNRLRPHLALHEYASAGLLLSIFSAYHAHFHQLHARIARISGAFTKEGKKK